VTRDVYYQKTKEHGNPIENKVQVEVEGDRFKDYHIIGYHKS
jgi:hypothetical protein